MDVSQRDIAKHLGLSAMTVSLALRNSPRLPEATRERIRRAADELGYRPDPALAALNNFRRRRRITQDHATIAFVTAWRTEFGWRQSYVQRFFEGASERAARCGYKLDPFWMGRYTDGGRASEVLHHRGIRGLLLAPLEEGPGEVELDWSRFAAVGVGPTLFESRIHRSLHDYDAGMRRILREMHARGYRRLALGISRRVDEITERRNSNTFVAEMRRRYPRSKAFVSSSADETIESARAWLQKHRPDCVVSLSWLFPRALESLGWSAPGDIGDVRIHVEPELAGSVAGVEYASREIGSAAIDKLDSLLQRNEIGLPAYPVTLTVRGKWLEGPTIRPAPDFPAKAGTTPGGID